MKLSDSDFRNKVIFRKAVEGIEKIIIKLEKAKVETKANTKKD